MPCRKQLWCGTVRTGIALTLWSLSVAAPGGAGLVAQANAQTQPARLQPSARQAGGAAIQQSVPVPSGASTNVQVQVQGAYAGSVPDLTVAGGAAQPIPLTLSQAIERGLRANLGTISSALSVQQAEAQRRQARSALFPTVSIAASENAAKVNLAAEGFSASAFRNAAFQFPTTVGPFHYYDLHGALQQSVLDVTALRNVRAGTQALQGAALQARQSREEVVLAVTGVYLQMLSDAALLERQRAEVIYADGTYQQARGQVEAGNKAPIEANRSLVELQIERQRGVKLLLIQLGLSRSCHKLFD